MPEFNNFNPPVPLSTGAIQRLILNTGDNVTISPTSKYVFVHSLGNTIPYAKLNFNPPEGDLVNSVVNVLVINDGGSNNTVTVNSSVSLQRNMIKTLVWDPINNKYFAG